MPTFHSDRDRASYVRALERLGRTRLSKNFFMRDFLHSEIAQVFGVLNVPEQPQLAIEAGRQLCSQLLEPMKATFGDVRIRSGYRSPELNALGAKHGLSCASNKSNHGGHIWDVRDARGCLGATATVVLPWFVDRYERGEDWRALAWYLHDHLPHSGIGFYPKLAAFNISWNEEPTPHITSYVAPRGILTRPDRPNYQEDHSHWYADFPPFTSASDG